MAKVVHPDSQLHVKRLHAAFQAVDRVPQGSRAAEWLKEIKGYDMSRVDPLSVHTLEPVDFMRLELRHQGYDVSEVDIVQYLFVKLEQSQLVRSTNHWIAVLTNRFETAYNRVMEEADRKLEAFNAGTFDDSAEQVAAKAEVHRAFNKRLDATFDGIVANLPSATHSSPVAVTIFWIGAVQLRHELGDLDEVQKGFDFIVDFNEADIRRTLASDDHLRKEQKPMAQKILGKITRANRTRSDVKQFKQPDGVHKCTRDDRRRRSQSERRR